MTGGASGGGRCRKVPFPTLAAAEQALLEARIARALRPSTKRQERRTYVCKACQCWHLTSQPAPTATTGAQP